MTFDYKQELTQRFLRYVAIPSQSDADCGEVPSTEGQRTLAKLLQSELEALGFVDLHLSEYSVLTGRLPATKDNAARSIGFVAHLDTVDVSLSEVVKPQILHYTGGDVVLNQEKGIRISLTEHPELADYAGDDIIFSDGTSVLGADNKAAVANIMTAFAYLAHSGRPHGEIYVAFVPDEEIGLKGSKRLDLTRFKPDFAYTIDSCRKGELVYETFNAGSAKLTIEGISAHPMSAKGVLINPLLVAHDFISMFPRNETPECTDKKDGYWWFTAIKSDPLICELTIHIRDFDKAHYLQRCKYIEECKDKIARMYPRAKVKLEIEHVYENISNNAGPDSEPVSMLFTAFEENGIKPQVIAMRGGTDGSALSARGLITPNYFTGAHNFHSYAEFLPLSSFEASLKVTLSLIGLAAGK